MPALVSVGRVPAEDRLRVGRVGNGIDQRSLLLGSVFLRLVDDQQIEALAQTAGGGARAEDDATAVRQLDALEPVLL